MCTVWVCVHVSYSWSSHTHPVPFLSIDRWMSFMTRVLLWSEQRRKRNDSAQIFSFGPRGRSRNFLDNAHQREAWLV